MGDLSLHQKNLRRTKNCRAVPLERRPLCRLFRKLRYSSALPSGRPREATLPCPTRLTWHGGRPSIPMLCGFLASGGRPLRQKIIPRRGAGTAGNPGHTALNESITVHFHWSDDLRVVFFRKLRYSSVLPTRTARRRLIRPNTQFFV